MTSQATATTYVTVDTISASDFRYSDPSARSTDVLAGQAESAFLERQFKVTDLLRPAANDIFGDTSIDSRKPPLTMTLPLAREKVSPVELLAEWSGCVTGIQKEGYHFYASLKGVKGEGVKGEEEDAIIPISDVNKWDKDLLRPGNCFRLCVMYEVLPSGQPRRFTQVVFRRLPAYRQSDLDEALERGHELARGLRVE